MKHKTMFRLLIKAVGVWIFCTGFSYLISVGLRLIFTSVQRSSTLSFYDVGYVLGYVIQSSLGLYLFFGGKWVADKAIPSNRPYCHECGYDLTGAVGNVCNECGTPFRLAAPLPVAQAHE